MKKRSKTFWFDTLSRPLGTFSRSGAIGLQLFFDNRDFFDFRERCALADIHVPIIAGIMPVTSMSGFRRIAELAGGARFPAKLLRALRRCENDPESVRRVGVHFALEQC